MRNLLTITLSAFMLVLFVAQITVAQVPTIKYKFGAFGGALKVNVKKQAKALEKQGWSEVPGELPLHAQLAKKYTLAEEADDKGLPKWIVAEQTATIDIESEAKSLALSNAKVELARLLESTVNGLIETDKGGEQTGKDQGVGLSKSVGAVSEVVSKQFGMIKPVLTLVKENKDGYTYRVAIAYNFEAAWEMYKKQLRLSLASEAVEVREKMEKILMKELTADMVSNLAEPTE